MEILTQAKDLATIPNLGVSLIAFSTLIAAFIAFAIERSRQQKKLSEAQFALAQVRGQIEQLHRSSDRLLANLSEAEKQQHRMASKISHELRTPLSIVYGYLQSMLRRSANLTTPQREALEIAMSETETTIDLLEELLDLARADSGTICFDLEYLVLNDLVAEVVAIAAKLEHRPIHLEAGPTAIAALADRQYLTKALLKLIASMARRSRMQQPIVVKLDYLDNRAMVLVCDCGIAMPPTRSFPAIALHDGAEDFNERLYAQSPDRTGFGLPIVRSLVQGMGGEVSIQACASSEESSTFIVTLPSPTPSEANCHKGEKL